MSGSGAAPAFLRELPDAVVRSAWGSACCSQAAFPGLCGPRVSRPTPAGVGTASPGLRSWGVPVAV